MGVYIDDAVLTFKVLNRLTSGFNCYEKSLCNLFSDRRESTGAVVLQIAQSQIQFIPNVTSHGCRYVDASQRYKYEQRAIWSREYTIASAWRVLLRLSGSRRRYPGNFSSSMFNL